MDIFDYVRAREILGMSKGGGGGGSGGYTCQHVISDGTEDLKINAGNNMIFVIEGYSHIEIIIPEYLSSASFWDCYFIIQFADAADVSLTLPEGIRVNGDTPNYVKPNDVWEVSLNKLGGAVCLRT